MYSGLALSDVIATDITPEVAAQAARDYWPIERELLATIVEMLDTLIHITAKANGGKNLPALIKVPRPHRPVTQMTDQNEAVPIGSFTKQLLSGGF